MFKFFRKNKLGLSKRELNFAKELNFEIRDKPSAILVTENLQAIAKPIYNLSAYRAKVEYHDLDNIDITLLMDNPNVLGYFEIYKALPEILKNTLSVVVGAVNLNNNTEEETLLMIQNILVVLLDETAKKLKEL